MMKGLSGKTIIVTGAGQGIGKHYAMRLATEGCKVVVAELNPDAGDHTTRLILQAGGKAISVATDVADEISVNAMVAATLDAFGGVDGVLNNAGLYGGIGLHNAKDISAEAWDRMMAVNVRGSFLVCRAAHHALAESSSGGRIVNVSSTTALLAPPGLAHYVTSKAAIIGLTRALAKEYGIDNITVNTLAPGGVWNEATESLVGHDSSIKARAVAAQAIQLAQMPEHLTGTACFLLSDEAPTLTGQVIVVDGGAVFY